LAAKSQIVVLVESRQIPGVERRLQIAAEDPIVVFANQGSPSDGMHEKLRGKPAAKLVLPQRSKL
jgi:hypothetical protein